MNAISFSREEKRYIQAGVNRQERVEQVLRARKITAEFMSHPIVIDDSEDDEEDDTQAKGG